MIALSKIFRKNKYYFKYKDIEIGIMPFADYGVWKEFRYKQTKGWSIHILWIFYCMKPNYLAPDGNK